MKLFPKARATAVLSTILLLSLITLGFNSTAVAYFQARGGQLTRALWVPQIYGVNFGTAGQANTPKLTRSADNEVTLSTGAMRFTLATPLIFEGASDDAFEVSFVIADPSADRSITFADAAGTTFMSTLATNAPEVVNSVWGVSNALVFEGATDDTNELTISLADPTSDRTVSFPNSAGTVFLSTLATNGPEVANAIWGASNAFVFEGSSLDTEELSIVPQDPTADRTVTLADASGAVNVGFVTDVLLCGDQANNGTVFISPVTGFASGQFYVDAATLLYNIAGTGCDEQDDATEGTADEIMFANNAFKVLGMQCTVTGSGGNGVTLNLRSAVADLTPDVTVTIPTGETTASTTAVTTTDIAANATFALQAISTEDLSGTAVWCMAKILLVP